MDAIDEGACGWRLAVGSEASKWQRGIVLLHNVSPLKWRTQADEEPP